MDGDNCRVQPMYMAHKKVRTRFKRKPSPNYIRQHRKKKGLTLERLAERVGLSHASLSRIERGLQPWNETLLYALAEALETDWQSLLMRDPTDPDGIWFIWDKAKPGERRQIVEHAKIIVKTGT